MTLGFWKGVMAASLIITGAAGAYVTSALKEKATVQVPLKEVKEKAPAPSDAEGKTTEEGEESTEAAAPEETEKVLTPAATKQAVAPVVIKKPGQKEPKRRERKKARKTGSKIQLRNIGFSLFSSTAKEVFLVGDFNNWYREPMEKKSSKTWIKAVKLKPGTYKYLYVIDGRRIKDPNNSRVSKDGKSVLVVKPLVD